MLDINALTIFAAVAQTGSFVGAARKLEMPTTNVSRRIQQLERDLACRLLYRTTRSLSLTETGRQVYEKALSIIESAAEVEQLALCQRSEPQGTLRLTAPISFANGLLGDWLIEFRLEYPTVSIDLIASNALLDFREHHLDFAIRAGRMNDSSLVARKILSGRFGVFAAPALLAGKPPVRKIEDLDRHPCLTTTSEGHALPWLFRKNRTVIQHQANGAMRLENNDLIHRAALAGAGIACLPVGALKSDIAAGRLVPVLESLWAPPIDVYLVYPSKMHLSAKNRAFIEFILAKCAAEVVAGS